MMNRLVNYFLDRHLLTNSLFIIIFIAGIFSYQTIKKEEFPDITFRTIMVQTSYPNSAAEDVEADITIPLEQRLQSVSGIRQIQSTSSLGSSSIQIEIDRDVNIQDVKNDISDAVSAVSLPTEVLNDPTVWLFDISKKAILDVGIYFKDDVELTNEKRFKLQTISRQMKAFLVNNAAFSDVRFNGYLSELMLIDLDPTAMNQHKLPVDGIVSTLRDAHRQVPVGETFDKQWTPVRIKQSLASMKRLLNVKLNRSFSESDVYLKDVATVKKTVERKDSMTRVNGNEAILLELVKSSETDILTAIDVAKSELKRFKSIYLTSPDIQMVVLNDESTTLRNRLSIIATNGLIGFLFILIALVIFLNRQSAFWVALGLPFCVAFTLVAALFFGLTINGITLSAIIIVLGIVVDDAIIIAEHIYRCYFDGLSIKEAAIKGVQEMMMPVIAGVTTTCMAFVPLLMFDNRFGDFVKPIPIVLFLMLGASLIESFFILPGHLQLSPPKKRKVRPWFLKLETRYENLITRLVHRRWLVLIGFISLMVLVVFVGKSRIKFVMFPHDESREIVISGKVKGATSLNETATSLGFVDETIVQELGNYNLGYVTQIARQRFGGKQNVNAFYITIEIPEANDRDVSADDLISRLKTPLADDERFEDLSFRKARWGQQSGSSIEIKVQSNNDTDRANAISVLKKALNDLDGVSSVEVKKAFIQPVIEIELNQNELQRLGVNTTTLASVLRTAMGGIQLFDIQRNYDPIEYKLRYQNFQSRPLKDILDLKISNNQGYLVPLSEMVSLIKVQKPVEINRRDGYRISTLFADLKPKSRQTPLDVANSIETTIFPSIVQNTPGVILSFDGEIIDSREGQREFMFSFLITVIGIYLILVLLFQSLIKPLRILFILPFGIMSVILVFLIIGKSTIGFFGMIGILGMLGVVVNDAIVLYVRLDRFKESQALSEIAVISKTRLRAILLTTITTVAGVMPTAYGIGGFDAMLSEMMLSLGWGLVGGMLVTLLLVPMAYGCEQDFRKILTKVNPRRFLNVFFIVFLFSTPAFCNELTDTQFIAKALANNPSYQQILEDGISKKHAADLSIAVSDIVTSVIIGSSFDIENNESIPDTTVTIGKLLYPTGTNIGLYYQNKRYAGSNFKIESYGASFSQDLLQNAFGSNNRLNLTNVRLQKQIIELQTLEALEDYVATLYQSYYRWAGAYKRMYLEKTILKNLELLQKEINLKYKRRVASKNDVNRIKLQLLTQQGIFKEAELNHNKEWYHVSQLINETKPLVPVVQELTITTFRPPTQNRSLVALALVNDVNINRQKISANELFPSISLDSSIYNEVRTVSNVSSETLYATTGLGIDLSLPNESKMYADLVAKSNLRQSKLQVDASLFKYRQDTFSLIGQLKLIQAQYRIEIEKRKLSTAILAQDGKDYRLGSLTLNQYIQSLNQSIQAQHMELTRMIQYHQARIEYLRLSDQLIKK